MFRILESHPRYTKQNLVHGAMFRIAGMMNPSNDLIIEVLRWPPYNFFITTRVHNAMP